MIKIVLNTGWNRYCLNEGAYLYLGLDFQKEVIAPLERAIPGGSNTIEPVGFAYENDRTNPKLVKLVEEHGHYVGGMGTYLEVVEIPDNSKYEIVLDEIGFEEIKFLE